MESGSGTLELGTYCYDRRAQIRHMRLTGRGPDAEAARLAAVRWPSLLSLMVFPSIDGVEVIPHLMRLHIRPDATFSLEHVQADRSRVHETVAGTWRQHGDRVVLTHRDPHRGVTFNDQLGGHVRRPIT